MQNGGFPLLYGLLECRIFAKIILTKNDTTMNKGLILLLIWVIIPLTALCEGTSETVNVIEAGTLHELVADLESTDIRQLKILGNINAADIKYLREGAGRLEKLEVLDIKGVTLIPSDEPYYTFGVTFDMLWSYGSYSVYISDHTSTTNLGLLDWYTTGYRIDSDGLAYAFTETDLKKVVLPSTIKRIGEGAFKSCGNLENVEVPEGIQAVDKQAFWKCSQLQSLNLSMQLTYIGESAFSECTSLTTIGNIMNVTEIGGGAFGGCSSFTGNALGVLDISSLSNVPRNAFRNCAFNEIAFSSNLTEIDEDGFYGCKNLKSVLLPNTIERIGSYAFYGCTSLTEVSMPTDLANIGYNAFNQTPWYSNLQPIDNVIYVGSVAEKIAPLKAETMLTIREGTTGVAEKFTYDYKNAIVGVSLPSTLRYIGDEAFANCENITQIDLPKGLENIGEGGFSRCKGLAKADLPTLLKVIGKSAFEGCPLKQVAIPESIDSIGDDAFCKNSSLISVSYNAPNAKGWRIFSECSGLEKVTIGAQVKVLPEYLFWKCTNLMRLVFDERTEEQHLDIYTSAFSECTYLDNVNFPLGIDSIASYAFSGCKLTTLEIPEGVRVIGNSAFSQCKTSSLALPKSLESIGDYCFSSMTNLKTLYFNSKRIERNRLLEDNTSLEKVVVGSEVQYLCGFGGCENLKEMEFLPRSSNCSLEIGGGTFSGCRSLQVISLPEGTTSIGSQAFYQCTSLPSLTLPATLETIGSEAFAETYGDSFNELVLPSSIKNLGYGAFYGNTSIKKVFYDVENGNAIGRVGGYYSGVLGGMEGLEEIVIGKHVRRLSNGIFYNSYSVYKITSEERSEEDVPLTVDHGAFVTSGQYDTQLKILELPYGTDSISDLPYLNILNIPETVEFLRFDYPNGGATDLYYNARCADAHIHHCRNITIGKDVEVIPKNFYEYSNTETELDFEPRDGNTPLEIGDNAFRNTTFYSCYLPRGTTRIGNNAFSNSWIHNLAIPKSVTHIGENAVNSESGVTIVNYQKDPLSLTADLMNEECYANSKLLVPMGSKEKYMDDNIWKKFTIEELDTTCISSICKDMVADIEQVYRSWVMSYWTNTIIDDVYYGYWISKINGNDSSENNYSLILNDNTSEFLMNIIQPALEQYGASLLSMESLYYGGILFKIPVGEGTVTLDARTYGNRELKVKIGNSEPQVFVCDEREEIVVNCQVEEPTYVYIYSDEVPEGYRSETTKRAISESDNCVQIYGFKWHQTASSIDGELISNTITTTTPEAYYSLDGKRLVSPQKGLNIIRMSDGTTRKVIIR